MIKLMPLNFPKKNLPKMKVYLAEKRKKPVARVERNFATNRDKEDS